MRRELVHGNVRQGAGAIRDREALREEGGGTDPETRGTAPRGSPRGPPPARIPGTTTRRRRRTGTARPAAARSCGSGRRGHTRSPRARRGGGRVAEAAGSSPRRTPRSRRIGGRGGCPSSTGMIRNRSRLGNRAPARQSRLHGPRALQNWLSLRSGRLREPPRRRIHGCLRGTCRPLTARRALTPATAAPSGRYRPRR